MPTEITKTNKKKVTSHHIIIIIKPRNLLEARVGLKCITIIQITTNYSQCTQQKRSTVHGVTQEAKKACSLLLKTVCLNLVLYFQILPEYFEISHESL